MYFIYILLMYFIFILIVFIKNYKITKLENYFLFEKILIEVLKVLKICFQTFNMFKKNYCIFS